MMADITQPPSHHLIRASFQASAILQHYKCGTNSTGAQVVEQYVFGTHEGDDLERVVDWLPLSSFPHLPRLVVSLATLAAQQSQR